LFFTYEATWNVAFSEILMELEFSPHIFEKY